MTAEEFVKSKYPNARVESHVQGNIAGLQKKYWLIRDGREFMYMAEGKTRSNAWTNAKKLIIHNEANSK